MKRKVRLGVGSIGGGVKRNPQVGLGKKARGRFVVGSNTRKPKKEVKRPAFSFCVFSLRAVNVRSFCLCFLYLELFGFPLLCCLSCCVGASCGLNLSEIRPIPKRTNGFKQLSNFYYHSSSHENATTARITPTKKRIKDIFQ